MNNYQLEAEKICNSLEDISQGKLFHKEDICRILEITLQSDRMDLLNELTFNAKYVQGLTRIIQKRDANIDEEYFAKVKSEFLEFIQKIKNQLSELLDFADDFIKSVLVEKYLTMSQESLSKLNELCSDLSYLKLFLNDQKR